MFRRKSGATGRYNFGRPHKEKNRKRHRNRMWVFLGKNKHDHDDDDDGVMMSGDSSPPPLRVSVPPSPGFDLTDDGRPGKTSPTSTSKILESSDTEAIEEALPINQKTLPAPEPRPKLERNGPPYDSTDGKKLFGDDDNSCVIKCISFAQQCCDCTIL